MHRSLLIKVLTLSVVSLPVLAQNASQEQSTIESRAGSATRTTTVSAFDDVLVTALVKKERDVNYVPEQIVYMPVVVPMGPLASRTYMETTRMPSYFQDAVSNTPLNPLCLIPIPVNPYGRCFRVPWTQNLSIRQNRTMVVSL